MPPARRDPRSRRAGGKWTARLSDLAWKLAAVAIAYGLWLAVVEEKQLLSQITVPVRFENLDEALALVGDRPSSVEVQVQGPEAVIEGLRPIDVEASIDLTGFREGRHTVQLVRTPASDSRQAPVIAPRLPEVKVLTAFPRTVSFELEAKLTREVPVTPLLAGEPLSGFEVVEVRAVPARVSLTGPSSAVEPIDEVRTKELTVDGKRASFTEEVWIDLGSPDVVMSQLSAQITVTLAEKLIEREFRDVALAIRGGLAEVRPEVIATRLRGPERLLAALSAGDVAAYVDVDALEPRTDAYEVPVAVEIQRPQFRDRIEVMAIEPDKATVRVQAEEVAVAGPAERDG